MTGSNDLDRMLASYLEEGPRRAPDRALDVALSFAAAHPRRRDPLLFLKPDVMARRSSMFSPQLAWVALVAVLALGAIAAFAIGTRPSEQPVVPPSVVESPSPSPSPSVARSPVVETIELFDPNNEITWPVTVTDASGTLVAAEPETQQDEPPVDRIEATNDPTDPTRVLLVWTFQGCAFAHNLTIDETGQVWRLERQECLDTLGGADQRMTLVFSEPVDATTLDVQLIETPR
jgi:hypothetical protein